MRKAVFFVMTKRKKQDTSKGMVNFRMKPDTYYIWCGGSCNYASKRRESGGAYIQNFDTTPSDKSANTDLIKQCIALKSRHRQVSVKVVSYHKYPQLPRTHELAHQAMREIMEKGKS